MESSKHPTPYVSNPLLNPTPSVTPPPRGGPGARARAAEVRAGTRVFKSPTPLGVPVPIGGPGAGAAEVRAGTRVFKTPPPHI
jgi:hypothetical protein